jgi:hypothetical protein
MNWEEVKKSVYYLDGSLRDIYVQNASENDWVTWMNFVNKNYQISMHVFETDERHNKINIEMILDYWKGKLDNCSTATIYLDDIKVNTHFFSNLEIENDITPTEVNSFEDHKKLLKYLIEVSKLLTKTIILTAENSTETILLQVDGDEITFPRNKI